jgi:hypothetical protein
MQQQQHHQRPSTTQQQPPADPFAPTPLAHIQQRIDHRTSGQQQKQQQQQQQQQQGPNIVGTAASYHGAASVGGSSSIGRPPENRPLTKEELEAKKKKEQFLLFTRVLMKYLEQKDPNLHTKAKYVIKECAERNRQKIAGYESVTTAMQSQLKKLVGEVYWKKAQDYMKHYADTAKLKYLIKNREKLNPEQKAEMQRLYVEAKRKKAADDAAKAAAAAAAGGGMNDQNRGGLNPPVAAPTVMPPSFDKMRQEIHKKREQIAKQSPQIAPSKPQSTTKPGDTSKSAVATVVPPKVQPTTAATTASAAPAAATTGKKKPAARRKSNESAKSRKTSTGPKASTIAAAAAATPGAVVVVQAPAPAPRPVVEEPPREYEMFMESIDHAIEYDWTSIGQLLGNKNELNISEEERILLYGDPTLSVVNEKKTPTPNEDTEMEGSDDPSLDKQGSKDKATSETLPRPSWGRKNVVSVRAAWARVRLKEKRARERAKLSSAPVVAGGLLTLPGSAEKPESKRSSTTEPSPDSVPLAERPWFNEVTAEKDATLALLSEGCQIYLKGVLEKAIQCARQRQNLDGIRLWHQQYASMAQQKETSKSSKDNKGKDDTDNKDKKKPPLSLRLGCDISRQVAQAHGNAAMTVKRMEEALARQPGIPSRARILNEETLLSVSSMNDLAWRPLLKEGPKKADYQAKRSFEIYGGKEAKQPPLGRVPKKAKLNVDDLIMGSKLAVESPYHKASTASSFISF